MMYAPKPRSREICDIKLSDGVLYLYSEAGVHRIEPYAEDIARVSYAESEFSDSEKPGVILLSTQDARSKWVLNETDSEVLFGSGKLLISVDKKSGSYKYYDGSGELLLAERERDAKELDRFEAFKTAASKVETVKTADGEKKVVTGGDKISCGSFYHTRMHLCWQDKEALYGLGQHEEGFMNLRGKTVYVYHANRKIGVPMLVSSKGYGILIDTYSPMILNDNEYGSYIYTEADNQMDYYFMNGGTPDGAVACYRRLTGKAALLPKWAFGYWQSRERYESFDEIINTVKEFDRRNIGIDCIVQDWCSWPDGQWGQKSFNPVTYANPDEKLSELHSSGVKFMLSIWPNPCAGGPDYEEFKNAGLMLETDDYYNAFDEDARKLYWQQVYKNLYSHGVDAWWCDSSEPLTPEWNHVVRCEPGRAYEEYIDTAKERFDCDKMNEYPFWHAKTLYDGMRQTTSSKRVVNLTRCAYTGQQRLSCVLWSGDISASWDTFRRQIAAGLNFCASGLPYWTTDIGGFFVKNSVNWYWKGDYDNTTSDPDYRELYVRWYQWATCLPVFRAHGTDCPREPWAFEDSADMSCYDALVKANHFRYMLLPYIYSTAAQAYFSDGSIIKPLGFEFSDDENVLDIKDQYMFGKSLMVCPITCRRGSDGYAERKVYLPKGGWYDMKSKKYYDGEQYISVKAAIDEMPIFVREGSIIPLAEFKTRTRPKDDIKLIVFGGKDAEFDLYEDAADGYGYENGEYGFSRIRWNDEKACLECDGDAELNFEVVSRGK